MKVSLVTDEVHPRSPKEEGMDTRINTRKQP